MSSMPSRVTVADVMTADVHTATLITPFKVLVRLIEENHVAAIPIVHGDRIVVGMVSESDLMVKERRHELESTDDFIHLGRRRRQREIAQGTVAADLMSSPPVTVAVNVTVCPKFDGFNDEATVVVVGTAATHEGNLNDVTRVLQLWLPVVVKY